ncbi:DUF1489 domain-containing protein [Microbaculum marinum]|uniref:DUF1489 domain-containing protein n=1 Tax=Microbaculum marinum TaxID=1764581 RepID=A0AAW9RID6_9HYPH
MTVNLIKLCVGADSVEDLSGWIDQRLAAKRRAGTVAEQVHVTRMTPKRQDELLDGGSLYWVIKGIIQCRQRLLELRPVTGDDGISRCGFVLEPKVVLVEPRPRGPFQGWRYLDSRDAPPDLGASTSGIAEMPTDMRRELVEMGLL